MLTQRHFATLLFSVLLAASALPVHAASVTVSVDNFATVSAWTNKDDGGQITVSEGEKLPDGTGTMRLQFPNAPVHYGNAVRDVNPPANMSAIEFDVKVLDADGGVYPFLWMWEKDGDGWNAQFPFDAEHPGKTPVGWSHVRVPVTAFSYDPRGNKIKEPTTINRMMIGFGVGRADVEIAHLKFELQDNSGDPVLSQTPNLHIERTAKGSVAILRDKYPHHPGDADPEMLAKTLHAAGYGVTFLTGGDLASRQTLTPANFDVLILPYGPTYPYAANRAIRDYLHHGGSFLSTGGYAFDAPIGNTLTTLATLGEPGSSPLNTRFLAPGDMSPVALGQVPVFDPGNPLLQATIARAAAGQTIVTGDAPFAQGEIDGYGATAVLGDGHAFSPTEWRERVPLIVAYDSVGRERGAVGALVYNYAGPYAKSVWALFGATNTDLFRAGGPLLPQLPRIVDAMVARCYLHTLQTDYRQYEKGETVNASVVVENQGANTAAEGLTFTVTDRKGTLSAPAIVRNVSVAAHSREVVTAAIAPTRWDDDLYAIGVRMTGGSATVTTGYTVPHNNAKPDEFNLSWQGNYFCDNGRPVLVAGVNMTASVLCADIENPLQWDIDLQRVQESGISFVRVTHIQPWYNYLTHTNTTPKAAPTELPKQYLRNVDSFLALARRHHIVVLYDLVDAWAQLGVTPEDRQMQAETCHLIAEHFKGIPGIVFDLSNEPMPKRNYEKSDLARKHSYESAWNAFLAARYATSDALCASWGTPGLTLGSVPLDKVRGSWSNVHAADYEDFFADILNKWKLSILDGVRSADPSRITLIGFINGYGETNKARNQDGLVQASMHSYEPVNAMATDLKLFDHSALGQGISLTEFGDVATHNRRAQGLDTSQPDVPRFVATPHAVFGQGGALFEFWIWKDMDDIIFPWGVNYAGNGPRKSTLLAVRNIETLLRPVRPVYTAPAVYLVEPGEELSGPTGSLAVAACNKIVEDLRARQIDFGAIDHHHLAQLPKSARVLIYPAAMIVPDDAYAALLTWTKSGGTLCIAGDFSYDAQRKRSHPDRLTELGGFTADTSPDPWQGPFTPHPTTATLVNAASTVNQVGKGHVFASLDPATPFYASALASLNLERYTSPTPVIITRIAEIGGGRIYFLRNPTSTQHSVAIACEPTPTAVTIGPDGVGLVRYDAGGHVTAIESQGLVSIGAISISMSGHFALEAVDGKPLTSAAAILVIPFGAGSIDLHELQSLEGSAVRAYDFRDGAIIHSGSQAGNAIVVNDLSAFDIRIVAPAASQPALAKALHDQIEMVGGH